MTGFEVVLGISHSPTDLVDVPNEEIHPDTPYFPWRKEGQLPDSTHSHNTTTPFSRRRILSKSWLTQKPPSHHLHSSRVLVDSNTVRYDWNE